MIYFPTTVVLVDDDSAFLTSVQSYLAGLNCQVASFSSPKEAAQFIHRSYETAQKEGLFPPESEEDYLDWSSRCSEKPFNALVSCVVSDFHMPQEDGLTFFKALDLPVQKLLLTGVLDHTAAVEAFNRRQIHKFIPKEDPGCLEKITDFIREEICSFFSTYFSLGAPKAYVDQIIQLCEELGIQAVWPLDLLGAYKAQMGSGEEQLFFCPTQEHLALQVQYARQAGMDAERLLLLEQKTHALLAPVDQLIEGTSAEHLQTLFHPLEKRPEFSAFVGYQFSSYAN